MTEEEKNKEAQEHLESGYSNLTPAQQDKVLKYIVELGVDKTEAEREELYSSYNIKEFLIGMEKSPRKNFRRNQTIAKGIEGGMDVLKTISNMNIARRQLDDADRLDKENLEPTAPPTTPKSQELRDATEMARRDQNQPLKDIDPILQRNMDLLRKGFSVADTASTGQAGVNAVMKQSAINQARTSNQQMIPAIEGIRRQQKEAYNRLVQAGISEDDMRFKQEMEKYRVAERKYLLQARATGNLRAAGNENLFNTQNQLFDQVGALGAQAMTSNYGSITPQDAQSVAPAQNPYGHSPTPSFDPNFAAQQGQGIQASNIGMATQRSTFSAIENLNPKYKILGDKIKGDLRANYLGNNIYNQ